MSVESSLSTQSIEFPSEVIAIIYGFLDPKNLACLYFGTSKATTAQLAPYLLHRIELYKASLIVGSEERDTRIKKIAEVQIFPRDINGALATAALIKVPYLKVRLLCKIGQAFFAKGNAEAAKKTFTQAREEATGIHLFIEIGKADPLEAELSFSKAEEIALGERNPDIKAQHMRKLAEARKQTSLSQNK